MHSPLLRSFPTLCLALILMAGRPVHAAVYVSGRVTIGDTGQPASQVNVIVYPTSSASAPSMPGSRAGRTYPVATTTQTLVNGSFVVSVPGPGRYHFTVDLEQDHSWLNREVTIPACGRSGLDLRMQRPAALHVRVLLPNGAPLAGYQVQTWVAAIPDSGDEAPAAYRACQTDAGGECQVIGPFGVSPAKSRWVCIGIRRRGHGCGRLVVDHWPRGLLTVRLSPGLTLTGQLQDLAGKPVESAYVHVAGMSENFALRFVQGWADAPSGQDGRFSISDLLPGRYLITAFVPQSGWEFRVVDMQASTGNVSLLPWNRPVDYWNNTWGTTPAERVNIRGTLRDFQEPTHLCKVTGQALTADDGAACKGTLVGLFVPGSTRQPIAQAFDLGETGPDGSFALQAPGPGRYMIVASDLAHQPTARLVDVGSEGLTDIRIELAPQNIISLDVRTLYGVPMIGPSTLLWGVRVTWGEFEDEAGGATFFPQSVHIRAPTCLPPGVASASTATGVTIWLRLPGVGCGSAHLDQWPTGPVTVVLSPGARIAGKAIDDAGNAMASVPIYASLIPPRAVGPGIEGNNRSRPQEDRFTAMPLSVSHTVAYSDKNGDFTIPSLFEGQYDLRVAIPGIGVRSRIVTATPGRSEVILTVASRPVSDLWPSMRH